MDIDSFFRLWNWKLKKIKFDGFELRMVKLREEGIREDLRIV